MTVQNERGTARLPIEEPMTEEARGVPVVCGFCRAELPHMAALALHISQCHGPGDRTGQRHLNPALSQPRGDQ